uniref:Cytochrome P450 n=1 Tax=Fagus sylvatica TaxID=28930 RepID=A0A2N9EFN8_FAGSY
MTILDAFEVVGGKEADGRVGIGGAKVDLAAGPNGFWQNPELRKGDFLDQILADKKTETFLNDNFITFMMFGLLLASFETISSTLTLAIKLINDHPKVIQELTMREKGGGGGGVAVDDDGDGCDER